MQAYSHAAGDNPPLPGNRAFALVFLALLALAGWANGQSWGFFAVSCGGAAAHLGWQFARWDPDVPEDGGRKFVSNGLTGCVVYVGLLLDYALSVRGAAAAM